MFGLQKKENKDINYYLNTLFTWTVYVICEEILKLNELNYINNGILYHHLVIRNGKCIQTQNCLWGQSHLLSFIVYKLPRTMKNLLNATPQTVDRQNTVNITAI